MYFLGLDLGQRRDFSAIAIVERQEQLAWPARVRRTYAVTHLERLPLGTSYMRVSERVCQIMRHPNLAGQTRLVVDATGVGAPVVDLLSASGMSSWMTAVTITGGEQAHGYGARCSVPKKDLLSGIEVLLESGELVISRQLKETERLLKELEAMHQANGSGKSSRGSEPRHDDLVLALALACWRAKQQTNSFSPLRLPGI